MTGDADAPAGAIRIVLADDHAIVIEGLATLLDDQPGFSVVGRATTGRAALDTVHRTHPDVLLLDITMPDLDGLEVTRQLAESGSTTRILILTMHNEEAFFFAALHGGASGYILKGAGAEELVFAIETVAGGGVYIPPQLAQGLVQRALGQSQAPRPAEDTAEAIEPLTEREQEVLRLIGEGLTNKEIAEQLVVSLNTVKSHRLRVYQKLGLHTRAELVAFARRAGILQ